MSKDLSFIINNVYQKIGYSVANLKIEIEGGDYNAHNFELNGCKAYFRTAKLTPKKIGYFVTLWTRGKDKATRPYAVSDSIDLVVINVLNKKLFGQFVFPKSVLVKRGIISTSSKEGKRGFRLYPPWDQVTSKQAQDSQQWQCEYFLNLDTKNLSDHDRIKRLYQIK